jgi:hypothetical protein
MGDLLPLYGLIVGAFNWRIVSAAFEFDLPTLRLFHVEPLDNACQHVFRRLKIR